MLHLCEFFEHTLMMMPLSCTIRFTEFAHINEWLNDPAIKGKIIIYAKLYRDSHMTINDANLWIVSLFTKEVTYV